MRLEQLPKKGKNLIVVAFLEAAEGGLKQVVG